MPTDTSIHVAYLGPEASFSHAAAVEFFRSSPEPVVLHPLPSFTAIFAALQASSDAPGPEPEGHASSPDVHYAYALLPIENSTNGSVVQVLDLLARTGHSDPLYPDLEVVAEHYLAVHHCLFVHPASVPTTATATPLPRDASHATNTTTIAAATTSPPDRSTEEILQSIKTIYTHPQVWGQCDRFLRTRLPATVERVDVSSTSAAAQLVAREAGATGAAAIASALGGDRHQLSCVAANIEDAPGSNTTRFLVMRNASSSSSAVAVAAPDAVAAATPATTSTKNGAGVQRRHKSLLIFTIPHTKPGALASALAVFAAHGFTLTSIDTRPGRARNWQYVFFVECESAVPGKREGEGEADGDDDDDQARMRDVLVELRAWTESLRYLGRFVDMLPREQGLEEA